MAARRTFLTSVLGAGTVCLIGTIAPSHFAFDANFKPFPKADPDGAKALVQAVGKGALSVEFLVPSGDPALLQQATLIQAQLRKADIDAQIVQLEFAQILKQQADHVFKGMTYVGWSGRVDPDGNTYHFNYTARPNNDGSYSNKDVDSLLDAERQTMDEAKRKDAFRKAEQIYAVDDPSHVWFRVGVAQLLTSKNSPAYSRTLTRSRASSTPRSRNKTGASWLAVDKPVRRCAARLRSRWVCT